MAAATLLQGGTVLTHDDDDNVIAKKVDILIEGGIITKIEAGIVPPSSAKIVDCKNKIVSPGFIDTHHHVWQTLLKGRVANELLLGYFVPGLFLGELHSPDDVFWGQLGGALECLDAGTTTVLDHAHINYSPKHSKAAIAATVSSGIRSIFGYSPAPRVQTWKPFALNPNLLEDWVLETMDNLADESPFGEGRVQIGLSFDGFFLPKEMVIGLFERAKSHGIKKITSHFVINALLPAAKTFLQMMKSYNLLDSSLVLSHANNLTTEDATLLLSSGAKVSSTPSTELQMAAGFPAIFDPAITPSIKGCCSLGIDCHSATAASIPAEMKLLLQSSRAAYNQKFINAGVLPKKTNIQVQEVFNLGTIQGARALGMENEIGSLAVGKKADIAIFDGLSPGMVCASEHDPVSAIVLHSSVADVEIVLVDGIIRKKNWKLVGVDLEAGKELWDAGKGTVEWRDVAGKLVELREELQKRVECLDMEEAKRGVLRTFYVDESKIVDNL